MSETLEDVIRSIETDLPVGWGWAITTRNYDDGVWLGSGFRAHIYNPILTPPYVKYSAETPLGALRGALDQAKSRMSPPK